MGWQWAIGLKGISGKLGNSGTGTGNPNYPNTNRVLGLTIRISNRVIQVRVIRVRVRVVRIWVMGNGFLPRPTANTFFHEIGEVHLLIQSWLSSEDDLQVSMGVRMKDKYDKYWGVWHTNNNSFENDDEDEDEDGNGRGRRKGKGKGKEKEKENINLLIFVAAVLDPRYKLSLYTKITIEEIFGQERGELVWEAINTCVHELFEEYRKLYAPNEQPIEASDLTPKGGPGGKLKEVIAKRMKMNNGSSSSSKSELDKYLTEENEDTERKLNILAWWKAHAHRFPILAHLARDVLAMPISTVASESAFSTSGRILDDFRTSLTPFMLEALVCTQDWMRRSTPIDIKESDEELAMIEKGIPTRFHLYTC